MSIQSLQANKPGTIEKATVIKKSDVRTFNKFDKDGKVCNYVIEDETGTIELSLWNEEADFLSLGDVIMVKNGWVKEWNNKLQISPGRDGKIEKL